MLKAVMRFQTVLRFSTLRWTKVKAIAVVNLITPELGGLSQCCFLPPCFFARAIKWVFKVSEGDLAELLT